MIRPARSRGVLGGAFPISTGRRPLFTASWKRLPGKILSRLTGSAPCWMTKPVPLARLGLPPAASFEPGGGFPPTVVRRRAVRRFLAPRPVQGRSVSPSTPQPRCPATGRPPTGCPSAHGMSVVSGSGSSARNRPCAGSRSNRRTSSAASPPRIRPASAMTAAASATPTSASSRSRPCANAGAAKAETPPPRLLLRPVSVSLAPHQNAGNGMRLASAGGSREQRTGTLPVPGREQRRTWKRPREQVLL